MDKRRLALSVVPLAFLAVFFAYPVASLLSLGLGEGAPGELLTDPGVRSVLWFTVWQATASTVLTVLIALPGAAMLARFALPGRALLKALVTVPFVLPTVVVGAAFLALIGPDGLLGVELDRTVWAILAAHVFFNYAVVVRIVGSVWAQLDRRQEEAARVLGASRLSTFLRVTLPALRPAIAAASSVVFLFTFTSFGIVQILGGPEYATLEVEIYRRTVYQLDLSGAAVLSLVQFAAVAVLLLVDGLLTGRQRAARLAEPTPRRPRGPAEWAFVGVNLVALVGLLMTPLAVLVERSFATADGYGLTYWRALAHSDTSSTLPVPAWETVLTSLRYGIAATAIAVLVGVCAAVVLVRPGRLSGGFGLLLMLPLGTSAVTVGFGFLIALDEPPLDLRDSALLVPCAQALVAVPFVVRAVLPVLRAIDNRLREAGAVLGATPLRVWWRVDAPLVWRPLAAAAGFAFAISLGEFGATVFIARADSPTIPVAIAQLLGRPGAVNSGQAMALATILMVVCATTLIVLDRLRPSNAGGEL
ncbi:ABC transporter permease [Cryptosporangium aurantiacum]|uniref:Thiamine transport system permease protein n=1 Tax=Cryptosporangium aurantiacum TaxID=134849 RepID=A0A1M7NQR7_9ACTN|nr:iron ABC transporter permease [Cryptosporangium aurantiacum]SHN06440.1 thiamine transport system permease protein [Cryptosporangium aurantiacum]